MKSIDFKSLLIGILGTALVMVLMGQSSMNDRYDVECVTNADSSYIQCKRFRLNGEGWNQVEMVMGSATFKWDNLSDPTNLAY